MSKLILISCALIFLFGCELATKKDLEQVKTTGITTANNIDFKVNRIITGLGIIKKDHKKDISQINENIGKQVELLYANESKKTNKIILGINEDIADSIKIISTAPPHKQWNKLLIILKRICNRINMFNNNTECKY